MKKDKYGYEIPDKANVMRIKTNKNSNPDQEKIVETAHQLIDKVMESFPHQTPQAANTLMTALQLYFVREYQNQIEKHERGENPMYQTICASIMHTQQSLSEMIPFFSIQIKDIIGYLKDKPRLGENEMQTILDEIQKNGIYKGK